MRKKLQARTVCAWCGIPLQATGGGKRKKYCSPRCCDRAKRRGDRYVFPPIPELAPGRTVEIWRSRVGEGYWMARVLYGSGALNLPSDTFDVPQLRALLKDLTRQHGLPKCTKYRGEYGEVFALTYETNKTMDISQDGGFKI